MTVKNIFKIVVLLVAFSISYSQVKLHNSLRYALVKPEWIEIPVMKIPAALKAEAFRRAFDSSYELYDPVNWYKNL